MSATLIASIVGVVLGGLGLVAGLIGYVQGSAALRRAVVTRQRAAAAEEAALQAGARAEASARAAERALDRLRDMGVDPRLLVTGPTTTLEPGRVERPDEATEDASDSDVPEADDPADAGPPPAPDAAPEPAQREDAGTESFGPDEVGDPPPTDSAEPPGMRGEAPATDGGGSGDDAADPPGASDPQQPAKARTGGQVAAGEQTAPPMDWAEAVRTGSIPLPARSRGTYAAPRRTPKAEPAPVRFEVRAVGRQRYEAVNVGDVDAVDAIVEGIGDDGHLVRPLAITPATVAPQGALAFSVLRVEGRPPVAQVRWRRDGDTAAQDLRIE